MLIHDKRTQRISRQWALKYTWAVATQEESLVGTHHESDGSLLINIDGDIGALDPGVGAQMSQSHVRVSAREQTLVHLFREHIARVLFPLLGRNHIIEDKGQLRFHVGFYLGTNESVFCSVVGSSSNRDAMSFP